MEDCLKKAVEVLSTQPLGKFVPKAILRGCKGIGLIVSKEFGVGVKGGGGSGVLMKHNDDGTWGPPAALNVDFGGIGLDFGFVNKYVLVVPMTDKALEKMTKAQLMWGAELGLALGKCEAWQNVGALLLSNLLPFS